MSNAAFLMAVMSRRPRTFEIPVLTLVVLGVVAGITCGFSLTAPSPCRLLRASIRVAVDNLVSIFFLYISEIERLFVVKFDKAKLLSAFKPS